MPCVKIRMRVRKKKGNSGLDEGRQSHLDDDVKIINHPVQFLEFLAATVQWCA